VLQGATHHVHHLGVFRWCSFPTTQCCSHPQSYTPMQTSRHAERHPRPHACTPGHAQCLSLSLSLVLLIHTCMHNRGQIERVRERESIPQGAPSPGWPACPPQRSRMLPDGQPPASAAPRSWDAPIQSARRSSPWGRAPGPCPAAAPP
jgi:hypothetical protein